MIKLPSAFQIDDEVQTCFDTLMTRGFIRGIHFYESKVKYDISLVVGQDESNKDITTRIYNVDSVFVVPFVHEKGWEDKD